MRKILVLSFLIVVCAGWALAQGTVTKSAENDAASIIAYWTPERMAAARPANPALPGMPTPGVEAPQPTGMPGATLGGGGGEWSLAYADDATLAELAASSGNVPDGYSYPPPENTWPIPVTWYGSYPLRTVGKMYFTQNGSNYVASASVFTNRGLITAGHCLADGAGNWSSNITVVPALRNAYRPYGTWAETNAIVPTEWFNNGTWCRDVGVFRVADLNGHTIGSQTGSMGFAWNWSAQQAWTGLGYPAQTPWVGTIMVATNASYSRSDAPGGCTPSAMGMGTRQTPGCSGGPWIWQFRAQQFSNNWVNGVFSFYYPAQPNEFFSPYFDTFVHDSLYVPAAAW
jgi:hypothetical protein